MIKDSSIVSYLICICNNEKIIFINFIIGICYYIKHDRYVYQNLKRIKYTIILVWCVGQGWISLLITLHKKSLVHTDGWVIISDSFAKQLRTDNATDWNINLGQPSGLSLLRSIRARNWNPIPYKKMHKYKSVLL